MLTHMQRECLAAITESFEQNGIMPTFREIQDALGLNSLSGVHRLVLALEERGFIRRLPSRARAIEILRQPAGVGVCPQCGRAIAS